MRALQSMVRRILLRACCLPSFLARTGRTPLALGTLVLAASAATALATQNTPPKILGASVSPNVLNEGQQAVLTLTFTDVDPNDYHTLRVKWHDGISLPTEVHQIPPGQKSISLPHTFRDNQPLVGFGSKIQVTLYDRQTPPGDVNDNTTGAGQDVVFVPITVNNVAPSFPNQPKVTSSRISATQVLVKLDGMIADGAGDTHQMKAAKWYGSKPATVTTPCSVTDLRYHCELTYVVREIGSQQTVTLYAQDDEGAKGQTNVTFEVQDASSS